MIEFMRKLRIVDQGVGGIASAEQSSENFKFGLTREYSYNFFVVMSTRATPEGSLREIARNWKGVEWMRIGIGFWIC